jgi:hypothetical protein
MKKILIIFLKIMGKIKQIHIFFSLEHQKLRIALFLQSNFRGRQSESLCDFLCCNYCNILWKKTMKEILLFCLISASILMADICKKQAIFTIAATVHI